MLSSSPQSKFEKFVDKAEIKLILALAYVAIFVAALIHGLAKGRHFPVIFCSLAIIHVVFMLFVGLIYFHEELLMYFLSPVFLLISPFRDRLMTGYLQRFKQNQPAEVVVILGRSNWLTLEGWLKPIYIKSDIKWLVEYLTTKGQDFSFYPSATSEDVERIMGDPCVKEVYFLGHGSSHGFELVTGEILYYCEFNDSKYSKAFAHQVHCGTPYGKSLLDYVVPAENRAKCFFFRKPINSIFIRKEFKRRIGEVASLVAAD